MQSFKLAATAILATLATSAYAVPAAQYSESSYTGNGLYGATAQFLSAEGTATSSITNPEGYVQGSATTSSFQRVSAQGDGIGYRNQGIESASGTYYFQVVGPAAVDVPIILSGSAELYATGGSSVSVYETYGRNGGTYSNFGPVGCSGGSTSCGPFNFVQNYSLTASTSSTAGDVGFTTLSIYLIAQEGSAYGFIDPTITIDPTFANAGDYHIEFSDGVGNPVTPVPEPAPWAAMLAGLGVVGGLVRTRRASIAVASI